LQLPLVLQITEQLSLNVSKLLSRLLHLGVAGCNGILERLGVLQPSLDQLIL
jgi:hypothetical protein